MTNTTPTIHHISKRPRARWIGGVSQGIILPCRICGKGLTFDFKVNDSFWEQVVDKKDRRNVICLYCLDILSSKKGLDVAKHLIVIQYIGIGKTIELIPTKIYYYDNKEEPIKHTNN